MAKCPFAIWKPISGPSGPHLGGPFKIVHHTTEGGSAEGAFAAYKAKRADPHFTVDENGVYQHIDTGLGARALRNPAGGVETNRDSAVQIELVGFAHQPKHSQSLINLARLCRWIESIHQVPRTWPAGKPKPAARGKDPGGHNRDPKIWDSESGHYGHCHVPENDHWDPGYTGEEADFVLHAKFDAKGNLISSPLPVRAGAARGKTSTSTMPGHHDVEDADDGDNHAVINIAVGEDDEDAITSGTGTKGGAKKSPSSRRRIKRILNARPDTLDFRDRMYVPTLIEVPSRIPLADYRRHGLPILDQGTEGACTGFGLAAVANYLLARRAVVSDRSPVSSRMFYELARRYDEWPGEDYSGSSARGAMKGWQKHGVCSEDDWPYEHERGDGRFTAKRMSAARCRPLGAYYRVNHKDLIAMHSAIAEVGILYATSAVHQGWNEVRSDGVIQLQPGTMGGHAFAIVAYDEHGFWIQNSWGESWGAGGFAKISYDDWLLNGTDVWVARLGAPVVLSEPAAYAQAHASTSGQSATYTYSDLRPHLISVGNDGRLKPGGDYGTTLDELEHIFNHDVRGFLTKTQGPRQLLLYAHGGLTNENDAVQRVAEYRSAVMNAGIYPLAFIWRTGYWTTMTNILEDALRRRRSEGLLSGALDFVLDRADDMLEPIARTASGKAAWDEMKENALSSSQPGGAADLVVQQVRALMTDFPDLQIHIVGHSAGSIFLAPVAQLLAAEGKIKDGPVKGRTGGGQTIASCTLWAPAITTDLFKATYAPLVESSGAGRIANMAVYCLADTAEQADHCARIYNKSLLYLVSHAFEEKWRIPLSRKHTGQPILGLVKSIEKDDELKTLFRQNAQLVLAPNKAAENSLDESDADSHGGFDDDTATVRSTLRRMLAAANVTPASPVQSPTFGISASRLRERRKDMDGPPRR